MLAQRLADARPAASAGACGAAACCAARRRASAPRRSALVNRCLQLALERRAPGRSRRGSCARIMNGRRAQNDRPSRQRAATKLSTRMTTRNGSRNSATVAAAVDVVAGEAPDGPAVAGRQVGGRRRCLERLALLVADGSRAARSRSACSLRVSGRLHLLLAGGLGLLAAAGRPPLPCSVSSAARHADDPTRPHPVLGCTARVGPWRWRVLDTCHAHRSSRGPRATTDPTSTRSARSSTRPTAPRRGCCSRCAAASPTSRRAASASSSSSPRSRQQIAAARRRGQGGGRRAATTPTPVAP